MGERNQMEENIFKGIIRTKFKQIIIGKTNKLYKFIIKY